MTTLIVKDMSRLGRDYLQVGYYTDTYFPDRNIRKFVGVIEIPDPGDNYTADTRKGVAVEYVTKTA